MKVGSLLYENTCYEWLHVVYCKYDRLLSWQTPPPPPLPFFVSNTTPKRQIRANFFGFNFFVRLSVKCLVPSVLEDTLAISEDPAQTQPNGSDQGLFCLKFNKTFS